MKKEINMFFDLDGTLLDISAKCYQAHKHAASLTGVSSLPFNKYWSAKRNRIPERQLIDFSDEDSFQKYETLRIGSLEDVNFLKYDAPFPWVRQLLRNLKKNNLFLVTARRNPKLVVDQLKDHKLDIFFNKIIVTSGGEPVESKVRLIKKVGVESGDLIIGDTEADILVARELELTSIAVYSGIRTKKFLKRNNPDFLVKNAWDYFEKNS